MKDIMLKSLGWEKFVSKFHEDLKMAMVPYKNMVLEKARIDKIINKTSAHREKAQWIYPSDHCVNHSNKGACFCAMTNQAIFERIQRGKYKVL